VVVDDEVLIVDEFTGRILLGVVIVMVYIRR
jgi:preprotein translocase subunit SecA